MICLFAYVLFAVAACGDAEDRAESPQRETATQAEKTVATEPAVRAGPEICLLRGGASKVERRGADLWRGFTEDGRLLRVSRFESSAAAKDAARAADLVEAAAAGRHAVFGTAKGQGSAQAVQTIADCLKNG